MKSPIEEEHIIEKLQAQKYAVQPSRALLHKILNELPQEAASHRAKQFPSFWWLRVAIPAAFAVLLGAIFLGIDPFQSSRPAPPPQTEPIVLEAPKPLNLASLQAEEAQIERALEFEEFFAEEMQMREIDSTLSSF